MSETLQILLDLGSSVDLATAAALVELGYLDEIRVRTLPCIKAILGYCA